MSDDLQELPAWGLTSEVDLDSDRPPLLPAVTREWAWGDSDGTGASVCVIDSGVDADHPFVRGLARAVAVRAGEEPGSLVAEEDTTGDASGHGTACAGIVRSVAPGCAITSVRVLGADATGTGLDLLAGIRWAVGEGFDVINLSLSTTRRQFVETLHDLADDAYFGRCVIVASAHNSPVESYPWRFSSVISVASHDRSDPLEFHYNPQAPVEFYGRGIDVEVAWPGGGTIRATGNSFATPHIAGICSLIAAKHPRLTPFQLKSVLAATAGRTTQGDDT